MTASWKHRTPPTTRGRFLAFVSPSARAEARAQEDAARKVDRLLELAAIYRKEWPHSPPLPGSIEEKAADIARGDGLFGVSQSKKDRATRLKRTAQIENLLGNEHYFRMYVWNLSGPGDAGDPEMLNLLGLAYGNIEAWGYDAAKAHHFLLKAAEKGSGPACYNLSYRWAKGLFGRIDEQRSLYWMARAADLGHGCATAHIAQGMIRDHRYKTDKNFRRAAKALLKKSGDWPWSALISANLLANAGNVHLAVPSYDKMARSNLTAAPAMHARIIMAYRHYLGLGVDRDNGKVIEYLDLIDTTQDQNSEIRFSLQSKADRLCELARNPSVDPVSAESIFKRFHKQQELLREDPAGNANSVTETFSALAQRYHDTATGNFELLADIIWARAGLAEEENCDEELRVWAYLNCRIELIHRGIRQEDLFQSKNDFGYLYNKRHFDGGLAPGHFASPRDNATSIDKTSRVPSEGVGVLRGITTTRSGEIEFQCDQALAPEQRLLVEEDFAVALALIFGGDKPQLPLLSLDPVTMGSVKERPSFLMRKRFEPHWVAHTELGKTLYAADYFMGDILWKRSRFYPAVGDEVLLAKPDADQILDEISLAGGHQLAHTKKASLHPGTICRTWASSGPNVHRCQVHAATIQVRGADLLMKGDHVKEVNKDDDRFQSGRSTGIMTRRYDDLAHYFPVLERYRQITVLLSTLNELHARGVRPGRPLTDRAQKTMDTFKSRPSLAGAQQYSCS